jgi:serine/threonine protein kinase
VSAPRLPPGTAIANKYRVSAQLGFGGATATYRAQGPNGAEVALKLFSPQVAQRPDAMKALERVYAETNALGQDVVAPILDAGYDPQTGCPFSATPLLTTHSLAAAVARSPMGLPEVSTLLAGLAKALDGAHLRQLFHQGIKPTNVFVSPGSREVRVSDFGVQTARAIVATHEGYALAAPWIAPEQLQGQANSQTDVFSAALVAFYALTGASFWRACQAAQPDLAAWQAEIMGGRLVASLRASELRVPLHTGLDPVFARALSANPAERPRTVGELAAAFEQVASARGPEAATTMAFPAIDDAPPPPGPGGGKGLAGTLMVSPGDMPAIPPMPRPNPPPGPAAPSPAEPRPEVGGPTVVASPAGPSVAPSPYLQPTAVAEPVAEPPKKSKAGLVIGLVALLGVLMAGLGGFQSYRARKQADEAAAEASAKIKEAEAQAAELQKKAADGTAAALSAATGALSGVPPVPTSEPSASASVASSPPVLVTITCAPGCDEVKVDGQVVDATKPVPLAPGDHKVDATKSGFKPYSSNLTVVAGKAAPPLAIKLMPEAPVSTAPIPTSVRVPPKKTCVVLGKKVPC